MLTPADLKNPARASGYNRVSGAGSANTDYKKPYQAHKRVKTGTGPGTFWNGPRRATAAEAAQDYCDAVNAGIHPPPRANKSAGHKRPQVRKPRKPAEVRHAEGVMRDWRAQQEGKQGYVYCFREKEGAERYVKIGYSVNPEKRITEVQTGNPRILEIVGYFPGTEADERALHRQFAPSNKLQEWFRPTPALLSKFTKPAARSGGQPKEAATK